MEHIEQPNVVNEPERQNYPHEIVAPAVLDTVNTLVVILDIEGRIVGFNRVCEETTGYCFEDVRDELIWDLLLIPQEVDPVRDVFEQLLKEGRPSQFENKWVTKDKRLRTIAWTNTLITGPDGKPIYIVSTGIDLTELRQAGEALRRSEAKNQALLNAVPDLMFQFSRDGVILDVNQQVEVDFFMQRDDFIGQNVSSILGEDEAEEALRYIARAFDEGETQVFEFSMLVNHMWRDYEARVVACEENEALGIVRDITQRKRVEEALQRRDAILQGVSFAAERFLESPTWEDHLLEILERLGQVAEVSRVSIYQNQITPEGIRLAVALNIWNSPGGPSYTSGQMPAEIQYQETDSELVQRLSKGKIVAGSVNNLPHAPGWAFEERGVLSAALIPIMEGKQFWGFLQFEECWIEREWSPAEIEALAAASDMISAAIERTRMNRVLIATLKISEAAHSAQDLDGLYHSIHSIISELMPARSFYIALYDAIQNLVTFPYFVDEFEDDAPPHKPGKGLTEYVLHTGKPLLASPEVFEEMYQRGEVESIGPPSIDWLGVPLKSHETSFGVLVVQSYTEGVRFSEADQDILMFVSNQVAMAIERKQSEEMLRKSEERYRSLVENIPIAFARLERRDGGAPVMANPAFLNLFGCPSLESFKDRSAIDMIVDLEERDNLIANLRAQGSVKGAEIQLRRIDGALLWGSVTARLVAGEGPKGIDYIDCAIVDITVRKRRDHEREAIISVAAALRAAPDRSSMPPVILESVQELLKAEAAALLFESDNKDEMLIERATGRWSHLMGQHIHPDDFVYWSLISEGEPYLGGDPADMLRGPSTRLFPGLPSLACVPLMAEGRAAGILLVGRKRLIQSDDLRILSAVGDMSANAINRANLHEQTQRRVQRLAALRAVDMAIGASLDLRVALNVLLDQLTAQLNVDAACVLLYNPHSRSLDYTVGRGFHTLEINKTHIRIGDGETGQAVVNQRLVAIPDLTLDSENFLAERSLNGEGFFAYYAIPLRGKGQLKGMLEVFHRTRFRADAEWLDFFETMGGQAAIAIENSSLFNELQRSNMELALAYDTTLEGWVRALEMRDRKTEGHIHRMMDLTVRLARNLGKREAELVHIRRGVLLHDIGKIVIPDEILQKEGELSDEEWDIMRSHPIHAFELLSPIAYLRPALDIPYCHHERWDGSGYPRGLKGEKIPLAARVFAVVDTWDSLLAERAHQPGFSESEILAYLRQQAGILFDPKVVDMFIRLLREEPKTYENDL